MLATGLGIEEGEAGGGLFATVVVVTGTVVVGVGATVVVVTGRVVVDCVEVGAVVVDVPDGDDVLLSDVPERVNVATWPIMTVLRGGVVTWVL